MPSSTSTRLVASGGSVANRLLLLPQMEVGGRHRGDHGYPPFYRPKMVGREESPSMSIINSRSVQTSHHVDSDRGINGNKKVKGRKEHIVVDTLGIPMAVAVHEANLHDNKGMPKVLEKLEYKFPRLRKILADGGYQGALGD